MSCDVGEVTERLENELCCKYSDEGEMFKVHNIFQFSPTMSGSLWINVFKRSSSNSEGLPASGVSLMLKRSRFSIEHFCAKSHAWAARQVN